MTQRSFDDAFWCDPFVQDLEKDAKYLFAYLWTNKHVNPACVYEITLKTLNFETGIEFNEFERLFEILKQKVHWYPNRNIVWVKNFIKRQPKSPTFLSAVAKCLENMNLNGNDLIVKEVLEYNKAIGVLIPYQYGMHTVDIPHSDGIDRHTELIYNTDKDIDKDNIKGGNSKKFPPQYMDFRKQVFAGLKARRGYSSKNPVAEAGAINLMLKEGYHPDSILKAYDLLKLQPFWQDKNLSMMKVRIEINEVLKGGTHKQTHQTRWEGRGNERTGARIV